MERLSALDATFLYFETSAQHQHVCAVMVVDPSTVPGGYHYEKIKEHIASRLHLLAAVRRKLMMVPLGLDHPVWVETNDFDLDYHVRRVGLPTPGTEEQLAELAADIASRQLDRSKPLWEMWIVEGLENGHVALIGKMHHSTVDGVSGANMMVHLLDLEPGGPRPGPDEEWPRARAPLEDIESVKRAFGTTVSDVVLAVAAGALRKYLEQLNELPAKSLMAVVPVSVRTDEEKDVPGSNKVSAMFTSLATDIDDPVERLRRIAEVNKGAKEEHTANGARMLQDWAKFAAPTTFSLAA